MEQRAQAKPGVGPAVPWRAQHALMSDQRLAEWLGHRQLLHLLPTLRDWGCLEPRDLTHLYASDIEQLGLKLAKARPAVTY